MDTTAKTRIAYNGPALASGEMEIKELAPALLAFAELIENANKALGNDRKIQVLLNQDSLRRGSFDITTILQYSILEQAKLFVSDADANGLTALMTVLGWGTGISGAICGIFSLLKKIRNRKITRIKPDKEHKVEIHLEDGDIIITTQDTMKIFMNVSCRESIEKVVSPLQNEGIDSFELRDPKSPSNKDALEAIHTGEIEFFTAPPAKQVEEKEQLPEQEMTVKITSITFEKGYKWRLTNGNSTFWASIEDTEFLDKVERGEISFTNGDMLRIRYYIQQTVKSNSIASEYIVTKVLEIKKRPEQIELDFAPEKQA